MLGSICVYYVVLKNRANINNKRDINNNKRHLIIIIKKKDNNTKSDG